MLDTESILESLISKVAVLEADVAILKGVRPDVGPEVVHTAPLPGNQD